MEQDIAKYKMIESQESKFKAKVKELKRENEELKQLLHDSSRNTPKKFWERRVKYSITKTHNSELNSIHVE